MVTYLYWVCLVVFCVFIFWGFSRFKKWKLGFICTLAVFLAGWLAYYLEFEQNLVKNYGGTMSLNVPEGMLHLSVTWKDDHLWVENYDPKSNICYFSEYSKSHVLQGEVKIEHCNPALYRAPTQSTNAQ